MISATASSPWFTRFRSSAAPRARLLCFPYAGGSSTVYSRWHLGLPATVDVLAVELPGRGQRRHEGRITDMDQAAEGVCSALEDMLDLPLFFFGHSLGALLAFATARALRRRTGWLPQHLFVSARLAPHLPNPDRAVAEMTDAELTADLRGRGGMAPEILGDPELMALFLPIIRADLRLLQSYIHQPQPALACPITALGGALDERNRRIELEPWGTHTSGAFSLEMFPGNHFFVNSHRDRVVQRVARVLDFKLFPSSEAPLRSRAS